MIDVKTEQVRIPVSDGTEMNAYVARPAGPGPHPAILVFQEIYGVNQHIRSVTDRYAAAGFVAVSPELFHRTTPGFDPSYENREAAIAEMRKLTDAGLEADARATFDWARRDSDAVDGCISAVGFCLGGRVAFLTNSLVPLRCAISYYGGGIAPGLLGRAPDQHGPMLLFWGGLDGGIGPDQRRAVADALTDAGKPFVYAEFSDADHGFFCDMRGSYNRAAAEQSWALAQAFLNDYGRG